MHDDIARTPFEEIVDLMTAHQVEFLVLGGQAESLLGGARVTFDTDLCYRRDAENLRRLAEALRELKPTLRGAPPGLPFRIDAESLALGSNFTFRTSLGDLDLLGYVEPIGGYDDLAPRAEIIPFGAIYLKVISLDDLIRVRQHLGRPKDRDSLMHLLAIKRIREEGAAS
jgi:hypothetical protein